MQEENPVMRKSLPVHVLSLSCLYLWMVVASSLVSCSKPPPPLKLQPGDPVPDLSLKDMFEKPAQLTAKSNKLLIINVWATWCGPCRHELPSLDRLGEKLRSEAQVVGISVDTDSHVLREYLIERKVGFPSYWDPDRHFARDILGVRVYPSTLLVSPHGRLIKVEEGWREWDTPKMLAEIRAVRDSFQDSP